jgi:hypothetical protein
MGGLVALACALGHAGGAAAQSLSFEPMTARAVARAGAGLVSDDTAAVWWQNPAGAARREAPRLTVGFVTVDTDLEIEPAVSGAALLQSRANSGVSPQISLVGTWKGTTLGMSLLSSQRQARRFEGPPADLSRDGANTLFSMRYAGLAGVHGRDTLSLGAARRLGDSLALGLSVGGSRLVVRETRAVWAGVEGEPIADHAFDVDLAFDASDPFIPTASIGAVLVPEESSLELAVAASLVGGATVKGDVTDRESSTGARLDPARAPHASLRIPGALVLRSGVRWQGQGWSIEGNGELELTTRAARSLSWQLDDVTFLHPSGAEASPRALPAQLSLRSLAHLRAAGDVEVIDGLLWLCAGAGWAPILTAPERLAPGFSELGGTTLAFGAEVSAGGITVAVGLSRTFSRRIAVHRSVRRLDGPFAGGDLETGLGVYESATDLAGISLEIEQL